MPTLARSTLIAAILAGIGAFGGIGGAVAVVVLGAGAATVAGRTMTDAETRFAEFRSWLVCTALFAAFVVVLIPFTSWAAVTLGLLLFAPVFGTMVCIMDRAVGNVGARAQ
jgi:hypothetical protein